jgi:hypothetical protein
MVCHLVSNPESPFYSSTGFAKLIHYAQDNPQRVHLKESTERLSITIDRIATITEALQQMRSLTM